EPGEAVAAAADRREELPLAGKLHGCAYVVDPRATRDQRRPAIDRSVPDFPVFVVVTVSGADERSREGPTQIAQSDSVDRGGFGNVTHWGSLCERRRHHFLRATRLRATLSDRKKNGENCIVPFAGRIRLDLFRDFF